MCGLKIKKGNKIKPRQDGTGTGTANGIQDVPHGRYMLSSDNNNNNNDDCDSG